MSVKENTTLLEPIKREKTRELPIRTIHESVFWEDNSPNWSLTRLGNTDTHSGGSHVLDMGADSYIWCFTGGRGGGKTTLMTYYAMKVNYLYNYRIISNYPIQYYLATIDGKKKLIVFEELDLYKLLCFDKDYYDCLILIDEAPDIVSHLASMTWKNRLLNIFIRQLRKNHNSLFMAAQQFELIDKSMRWQTDILAQCQDASRKYGWASEYRGMCILCTLLDNSGMWTGETWQEAIERNKHLRRYHEPGLKLEVYPRFLWADNECKPVFDSYYQQDVWESLKKVDIKLLTYEVGQSKQPVSVTDTEWLKKAAPIVSEIMGRDQKAWYTKEFYSFVGALTTKEKDALSKRLNEFNVRIGQAGNGQRYYDFSDFDLAGFLGTWQGD